MEDDAVTERRPAIWLAAAAVAAVALVAAAVWLVWPRDATDIDLVGAITPEAPQERWLEGEDGGVATDEVLVAARRLGVRGAVRLPAGRVLAADEIVFEPGARIEVPGGAVTLVAPVMRGVTVDVSGGDGVSAARAGEGGADGRTGGSLFVAAALLEDVHLRANGGDGGDGRAGYAGAVGANGYCGPRGFRIAERGGNGGDGGAAGDGGDGGLVTVFFAGTEPDIELRGGAPGAPGAGGAGGRGGAGCKGVRGEQEDQPPGNDGRAGRAGRAGDDAVAKLRRAAFADVADAFEAWLAEDERVDDALWDRLVRVPVESE
jgi:hypothetical protein